MTDQLTQKKKKTFFKIFSFIKGVIAFLVVTLSLFHIFLESKSTAQIDYAPKYKEEFQKLHKQNIDYVNQLDSGIISKEEYIQLAHQHLSSYKPILKEISEKRKQLAEEHSFRGRSSLHFWIFVFGLVAALFFFSCKSLFDDISKGSTFKFQLVSLSGILVSFFWFIHLIFLTQKDFQENNYITAILVCAVLFSFFTYYLLKHYTYKDDIIYRQLSLLQRIKTIHYHNIALKALYAEEKGEPLLSRKDVSKDIQEFQADLKAVTENI